MNAFTLDLDGELNILLRSQSENTLGLSSPLKFVIDFSLSFAFDYPCDSAYQLFDFAVRSLASLTCMGTNGGLLSLGPDLKLPCLSP